MSRSVGPILAALFAAAVTRYLASARAPRVLRMLDVPNERSLHARPTPRTGGLGILAGLVVSGAVWLATGPAAAPGTGGVAVGAAIVAGVSLWDDFRKSSPLFRLLMHLGAASFVAACGTRAVTLSLPGLDWAWPTGVSLGFSVLYIVWMTNLYNFMDGMDGFAGGMTVWGFGACAALGWVGGRTDFAMAALLVAAAALGFLRFNFPPARIFMGDVGSSTLGFLAAGLTLIADRERIFPLWIGVLVFSPFVIDATVTLARRLAHGEKVWQAHRSHFYQRLVQLGWGHRKTVLWEYALMVGCAAASLWAVRGSTRVQAILIGAAVLAYLGLGLGVTVLERRRPRLSAKGPSK
jgi:UDP-N-acetylmuramyl pentapeptide phosphotransferase/UDP-N-acetylglucosamine-1-phosphate transferase